jgi:predicted nucleotidyltransferase
MNAADPNVQRVELIAAALGDLCADLVLVGGCAASLLIDAPTAPLPRVTYDVDLLAELAALGDYYAMEAQFASRGLVRDLAPDAPICRWRLGTGGGAVAVDLMPTDAALLGFSNRWYPFAAASAQNLVLPSGQQMRLISPAAFLATKFEAFWSRGRCDLLISHDLEDIINVLEGCLSLDADLQGCAPEVRSYLAQ